MILLYEKIFLVSSKFLGNGLSLQDSDALYSTITPTFFKKRATPSVVAKTEKPTEQNEPSQPTSENSQVQNQPNQSSKSDKKRPDADYDKIDEENKQITSIEDSLPIY